MKIKWIILLAVILIAAVIVTAVLVNNTKRRTEDSFPSVSSSEDTKEKPRPDIASLISENEKSEGVFDISLEDFIDLYNSVYGSEYLAHPDQTRYWYTYDEPSPLFGYSAVRMRFTEDKALRPLPTVSFYTADDVIYEIRMTFDDHSYQDTMYEKYRVLVLCMEKTLMPELTEERGQSLFDDLFNNADVNLFGQHTVYGDPERPALKSVYKSGSVGVYSFYGSGNIEICFVPMTATNCASLNESGTAVNEIANID